MKGFWGLFFLAVFSCTPPAYRIKYKSDFKVPQKREVFANKNWVRIKLHEGQALPIEARSWVFYGKEGKKDGEGIFVPYSEGTFISQNGIFSLKGKSYQGKLKVYLQKGRYLYVNYVDSENYLISVVSHEMSPTWPLEALKAQAVVARTYLYQKMEESQGKLFDVEATTNHQVYGGVLEKNGLVKEAIFSTKDQVLFYQGELAQVFFHSCCGGVTASSGEVWGKDFPYLVVQRSLYCSPAPVFRWQVVFSLPEIARRLRVQGLRKIEVAERSSSKRVKWVRLYLKSGVREIKGDEFRRFVGVTEIKSTYFALKQQGQKVFISGRGYGHGVGLCQWGSRFMAENQGMDYRRILQHYFPGTTLVKNQLSSLS